MLRDLTKKLAIPVLLVALASCSMFEGRETAGEYLDDTTVTARVKEALISDPTVKARQVNVETMQGVVQLSGFVDSVAAEQQAVRLASQVQGVKAVKDNIVVRANKKPKR